MCSIELDQALVMRQVWSMDFRNSARPIWLSLVALLCSCSGQQTYDDGTDSLGSKKPRRDAPDPAPVVAYDSGITFSGVIDGDAGSSGITEPIPPAEEVSADAAALFGSDPEFDVDGTISDLIFADGRFVAVGGVSNSDDTYSSRIYTSTDGEDWTLAYAASGGVASVAFGSGVWVAVGGETWVDQPSSSTRTSPLALRSTNGVDWTPIPIEAMPFDFPADQVVFTGSNFLAKTDTQLLRSTDGSAWVEVTTAPSQVYRLAVTDSAVFGIATEDIYFTDDQGDSWTVQALPEGVLQLTDVWQSPDGVVGAGENICCFGEIPELNRFFEVRQDTSGAWTATEAAWNAFHPTKPFIEGDLTVARGRGGLGYRNMSAADWTQVPIEEFGYNTIHSLAENNGVFVAAGNGALRWSTDGKEWHPATVVE